MKVRVAKVIAVALGVVVTTQVATQLWAYPEAARQTKQACVTCHTNPSGGMELSEAGKAFKADAKSTLASAVGKAAEYVGNNKCKMCHMKQHTAWSQTPHAKAWDALLKDPKKNAEMAAALKITMKDTAMETDDCVRCHVVGFQLAGGFPQTDEAKAASVRGVGCESCHGPGSLHVAAPAADKKKFINKPGEKLCVQCHTAAISPAFKFAEMSAKVHPVAK